MWLSCGCHVVVMWLSCGCRHSIGNKYVRVLPGLVPLWFDPLKHMIQCWSIQRVSVVWIMDLWPLDWRTNICSWLITVRLALGAPFFSQTGPSGSRLEVGPVSQSVISTLLQPLLKFKYTLPTLNGLRS